MKRVVLHAGFHKTGTKSTQAVLRDNRALLAPHCDVLLREDIPDLVTRAKAYSARPDPQRLAAFESACRALLGQCDDAAARALVISCEDLGGVMPGRRGVTRYEALPELMAVFGSAMQARFGDGCDLTLYFSTRDAQPWLNSLWWQHLRSTRLDEPFDAFARQYAGAADLTAMVARVAARVPRARVKGVALEQLRTLPLGPATALLDLAALPSDIQSQLHLPAPENRRPPRGLEPIFLELNRSDLPDNVVTNSKKHLMRATRRL